MMISPCTCIRRCELRTCASVIEAEGVTRPYQ
jgi:hypothetical protein